MDFLRSINWVDLLVLGICIRAIYMAVNAGFFVELLKFIGLLIGLFVALHYYTLVGGLVEHPKVTQSVLYLAAFLVLWGAVTFLFKFVRDGFLNLFTIETHSAIDKLGGVALGILRAWILAGMVLFALLIPESQYLSGKVVSGVTPKVVVRTAPSIYKGICVNFVSKVFPGEEYNPAVRALMAGLPSK